MYCFRKGLGSESSTLFLAKLVVVSKCVQCFCFYYFPYVRIISLFKWWAYLYRNQAMKKNEEKHEFTSLFTFLPYAFQHTVSCQFFFSFVERYLQNQ